MAVNGSRFITFEGGEGTGKSTQARKLAEVLRANGQDVVLTREPGGTPGAEAVRQLLLHPPGGAWSGRSEALLFAAARADHVAKVIRPALDNGFWVICDRYIDSSRAYQGQAGGEGDDLVMALHRIGSEGLMPWRTVLLTVNPEEAARRLHQRDGTRADAIEARGNAYHHTVTEAFDRFAAAEPERFIRLSGNDDVEDIHLRILKALGIPGNLAA